MPECLDFATFRFRVFFGWSIDIYDDSACFVNVNANSYSIREEVLFYIGSMGNCYEKLKIKKVEKSKAGYRDFGFFLQILYFLLTPA